MKSLLATHGLRRRGLALRQQQHSYEETSQRSRDIDGPVFDFTKLGIELRTSASNSEVFNPYNDRPVEYPHSSVKIFVT